MNIWGIDVYKKEVLSFLRSINKLMLLSICIDSMMQSGVLLSLGPWKILKLLKIFWYSLFFSYFRVRHGHGAHLATHYQSKKHIFKPKRLSNMFGNRKNHGMTPQFTHKKHVLPLDHQPSIFIPCFCKKARFVT